MCESKRNSHEKLASPVFKLNDTYDEVESSIIKRTEKEN